MKYKNKEESKNTITYFYIKLNSSKVFTIIKIFIWIISS